MQQPRKIAASTPSTPKDVYKFASGRRRYNKLRQQGARLRRLNISANLTVEMLLSRGYQARLARHFGVHRSTICRDMEAWWQWMRRQREGSQG